MERDKTVRQGHDDERQTTWTQTDVRPKKNKEMRR